MPRLSGTPRHSAFATSRLNSLPIVSTSIASPWESDMQAVKDSFYMALRQRLAQSYPTRSMGDTNQPALIVCENVSQSWVPANDVFYLRWTSDEKLSPDASAAGWRAQQCEITYGTAGSESANGEDRG